MAIGLSFYEWHLYHTNGHLMDFTTFKLNDIITYITQIQNLTPGSIPFWLSIAIPLFYWAVKKLLGPPPVEATTIKEHIANFFSTAKFNDGVIYGSLLLFIIGVITIKVESNNIENMRRNGIRIKKYMVEQNLYSIARDSSIEQKLGIKTKEIDNLLKWYPAEFLQISGEKNSKPSIVITDSATYWSIVNRSERILDSYLSNPIYKHTTFFYYSALFETNNFFTHAIINKLIADSSFKYHFGLGEKGQMVVIDKDTSKRIYYVNTYLSSNIKQP